MSFASRPYFAAGALLTALVLGWFAFHKSPPENSPGGRVEPEPVPVYPVTTPPGESAPVGRAGGLDLSRPGVSHLPTPEATPESAPPHLHSEAVVLADSLPDLARRHLRNPGSATLRLPDFHGGELLLRIQNARFPHERSGVMTGAVEDQPDSFFSLAFVEDGHAGSVHLPASGRVFELAGGPGGTLLWNEIHLEQLGHCGLCAGEEAGRGSP